MSRFFLNVMCSWICCFLILYPTVTYADEVVVEQPTPLKAGTPAPFNGVLIPTLQAAEMTAKLEQQESKCNLRVQTEVERALSRSQLLLDNCTSSREIYDEMYKTQLASQQDYINFLEKRASGPKISQEVVFIIGVIAGVGITIGAGYAMTQAAN